MDEKKINNALDKYARKSYAIISDILKDETLNREFQIRMIFAIAETLRMEANDLIIDFQKKIREN